MKPLHLNLAARPFRDYRPVYAVVVVMSIVIAFLMLNNIDTFVRYQRDTRTTRTDIASIENQIQLERRRTEVAQRQIGMLWLAVRPGRAPGSPYRYFADLSGHAHDARMRAALDDLAPALSGLRVLGAYPRGRLNDAACAPSPGH